jgi:hypothetical protein
MRPRMIALSVLAALLVGGCFAANDAMDVDHAAPSDDVADEAPAPSLGGDGGADEPARARAAGVDTILAVSSRKIIRNASVELLVEDADEAVRQISDLARRLGGFVANADLRRQTGGELRGQMTIRVPADELDRTLEELTAIAISEEARTITTDDVTGEYHDVQARLDNLRAFERELLALLETVRGRDDARAENLLTVFERIRQVREEIERLEGRLNALDELVSLSTVRIHLSTPAEAKTLGEPALWRPLETLTAAGQSLLAALQVVATVVIWIAVFVLPLALLVSAPAVA